jgi:hypothetical protein
VSVHVDQVEAVPERQAAKAHVWDEPRMNEPIEKHFLDDPTRRPRSAVMERACADVFHARRGMLQQRPHVDVFTPVALWPDQEDSKRSCVVIV